MAFGEYDTQYEEFDPVKAALKMAMEKEPEFHQDESGCYIMGIKVNEADYNRFTTKVEEIYGEIGKTYEKMKISKEAELNESPEKKQAA